jgi:hypothetical protein
MKNGWKAKVLGEVIQLEYGKPLDPADRKHDVSIRPTARMA